LIEKINTSNYVKKLKVQDLRENVDKLMGK